MGAVAAVGVAGSVTAAAAVWSGAIDATAVDVTAAPAAAALDAASVPAGKGKSVATETDFVGAVIHMVPRSLSACAAAKWRTRSLKHVGRIRPQRHENTVLRRSNRDGSMARQGCVPRGRAATGSAPLVWRRANSARACWSFAESTRSNTSAQAHSLGRCGRRCAPLIRPAASAMRASQPVVARRKPICSMAAALASMKVVGEEWADSSTQLNVIRPISLRPAKRARTGSPEGRADVARAGCGAALGRRAPSAPTSGDCDTPQSASDARSAAPWMLSSSLQRGWQRWTRRRQQPQLQKKRPQQWQEGHRDEHASKDASAPHQLRSGQKRVWMAGSWAATRRQRWSLVRREWLLQLSRQRPQMHPPPMRRTAETLQRKST
jgi:hypothetical protein